MDEAYEPVATLADDTVPITSTASSWGHALGERLKLRSWSQKLKTNSRGAIDHVFKARIKQLVDHSSLIDSCCSSCSRLSLHRESFVLGEDTKDTPKEVDPVHTTLSPVNLGYLNDIYKRKSSCAFCRLVYKATKLDVKAYNQPRRTCVNNEDRQTTCWMEWLIDGRTGSDTIQPSNAINTPITECFTRRIRLYSKDGSFSDAYLVLLSTYNTESRSPSFLGRIVDPRQASLAKMSEWIGICEQSHKEVCRPLHDKSPAQSLGESMRLIDVNQMCLVTAESTTKYVTLSYCWGKTKFFKNTRRLYAKLRRPGFLNVVFDELGQTIQDAILLVRSLNMGYLWVDSICIVQDEIGDWTRIAPVMDRIYGYSTLTICAGSGGGVSEGLPRAHLGSRRLIQYVERVAGLELMVVRSPENYIRASPWNSRAWTFQERLLSRRCLIFVGNRVFFQCRRATWSEELDSEGHCPSWTLDIVGSPLKLWNDQPLRRYSDCVQIYSGRRLTFVTDKMIAFTGLGDILASKLQGPLLYCLPTAYFDWSLLWEPIMAMERIERPSTIKYPSWSWCGWVGGVEWRLSTTSGILNNMHEWLVAHTWIIWYKGSKNGTHTLVWQASEVSTTMPTRWNGYTTPDTDGCFDSYGRLRKLEAAGQSPRLETVPKISAAIHCLQFWTYSAFFNLVERNMSDANFKSVLGSGLHRYDIEDSKGDWCGTIILDNTWAEGCRKAHEFIAISEVKDLQLEEFDSWTYYIPQEREQAEWYLYYALMTQWNDERTVAKRVGLAKIFKEAFHSSSFAPGLKWKEIALG
ncbi:uncharacterized protein EAE98_000810 [Botrytis deweyae]|uniref:Heterokaryon incompatibility domain-containing protein n=1 Tax=Botrytis deweyae TaxID=2478750 RepID=A0ABQ7IZN8_9HELO|nr:uncharacterized protein EAE98_000810 [Botrytis deweyae]KAF7938472.1 hypothetical protein EAE98_000810 [Botrytis deweyae]